MRTEDMNRWVGVGEDGKGVLTGQGGGRNGEAGKEQKTD